MVSFDSYILWFCSNRPQELTKVNPSPCGNHKRINRSNYPCWLGCLSWKHFSDSRGSKRLRTSNSISWRTLLKKPWTDLLDSLRICDWVRQKATVGLPWWHSGWESACQCRGHGFEPWSGRIPHAAEQLGPWATIAELARLKPVLHNRRGHDSERPAHRDEEWPPLATARESPRIETKTQHSHR